MVKRVILSLAVILWGIFWLTGCGYYADGKGDLKESESRMVTKEKSDVRVLALEELEPAEICCKTATHFAFERLSPAEQIWYLDIKNTLADMLFSRELSTEGLDAGLTEKDIDKIFQCVLTDHPEFFYVEGYTYTRFTRMEQTVKLEFSGSYSISEQEAVRRKAIIEEEIAEILEGVSPEASDYEKVKYVYETLIRRTEYDMSAPDNQNMYSVFAGGFSVCQGYAKAVQYLLNRLGVECTMVTGTVNAGEGHAWNLVKVDGAYYYVDATWGDASYIQNGSFQGEVLQVPEINYDYLCVNTEQLQKTHTLENVVELPFCTALENNYYFKEGFYFTAYDEKALEECFQMAMEKGQNGVTLKCADLSVYNLFCEKLIVDQGIFRLLNAEGGPIAYAQNENQLSMTFWVTNE